MDKNTCARCNRVASSLYACSICRTLACSKCFLDNLMMCKVCLTRSRR